MKVASFYRFLDLSAPEAFKADLQDQCDGRDLLGVVWPYEHT